MNAKTIAKLIVSTIAFALPIAAVAQQHGGNSAHPSFHGGGTHVGQSVHGSMQAAPAFHGGYNGNVSRGYGGRGYVGSVRSGGYGPAATGRYLGGHRYYGRPYYGPGWYGHRSYGGYGYGRFYAGLAIGTFIATLPLYYDTFWWDGVPYYRYDSTYFRYNRDVQEYEVIAPPENADASGASAESTSSELYVYPKNGQSDEQQKTDRYECHRWAADQTGADPTAGSAISPDKRADYVRAETACLTGRGYSVR